MGVGDATSLSSSCRRREFLGTLAVGGLTATAGCITRGEASDLEGQIVVDGSDTVLPHAAAMANEFMWRNNRVSISVSGAGTGAGFQRFCAGETTIQDASRPILPDEETSCEASGVDWVELQVALDGIAVFVHPENDWIPDDEGLTVDELKAIWERDSTVNTWADVREGWPNEEIGLFGRDSASGTFDYFTEHIIGEIGNIRRDYSGTPDTNVIVRGVRGDKYGLGWGGAGYYYENEDDLKLVGIAEDESSEYVFPTRKNIEEGVYTPLSRALYIYIRRDALKRRLVRAYTRFFFEELDEQGYRLAQEFDIIDPGEALLWTQYAARRVGYFALTDGWVEREIAGSYTTIDEYVESTLEAAIDEVTA